MRSAQPDPRQFITTVSFDVLVHAWSSIFHDPFGPYVLEGVLKFNCAACGGTAFEGGGAHAIDSWRWKCDSCQFVGTRMQLEREILEDAKRLGLVYELAAEAKAT